MNVNEFIDKAVQYEKVPTLYKLGKFMNSYSGKYLLCDCSGLIKGILWGYPNNGKYKSNGIPDINADTMLSKHCATTSRNFNHLPIGALVHMKGHIGIHVGNGVCVEASPKWENGIQKTFINGCGYSNTQNLNVRTWADWGLFNYIDYNVSRETYYPTCTKSQTSIVDYLISIGEIGNLANRKVIARQNGIANYSGTYDQNVYLLDLAKQGKLKR